MLTVVPRPGSLWIESHPPCFLTIYAGLQFTRQMSMLMQSAAGVTMLTECFLSGG
jgi:hypothetical protein